MNDTFVRLLLSHNSRHYLDSNQKSLYVRPHLDSDQRSLFFKHTYGSSEVASLLGKNKFVGGTTLDLYLNKIGYDIEVTERMRLGLHFEEPILRYWEKHYFRSNEMFTKRLHELIYNKNSVSFTKLIFGGDMDILRATPDAIIYNLETAKATHIVDIKNMDKHYEASWNEEIPEIYQVQAQLYMSVLNINQFVFVCCFGGNKIKEFHLRRDGRLFNINSVRKIVTEFHENHVIPEKPYMEDHEHEHYGIALARFYGEDYINQNTFEPDCIVLSEDETKVLDRSKRLMDMHEMNYNTMRSYICQKMLSENIDTATLVGSTRFKKATLKESKNKGYYVLLK